ncbi:MAG TPA: fimbria/pilus periplasmic chaperone [Anaeromyxobacteraceae bacterium]|nr:fimbria/pilus periplasmic chaperone [Anaeromyxobacteraceae bacterium]
MPLRLAAAALAAFALLVGAGAARAAEVQVGPVLVTLTPSTRSALVTVHNQGKEPVRFELQAKGWSQGEGGEMELSPTDEIAVYPPVLTVAPGEERNLRVGAVAPFGATERAYRIVLQELAPPETPESGAQVRMLTRMLIPVFLAPARPVEKAALAGLTAVGGRVTVRLVNEGTVHVRPDSVKLSGLGEGGKVLFETELPAWYVLAGGVRAYEAKIPAASCGAVREVEVAAVLSRETLRARQPRTGDCSP